MKCDANLLIAVLDELSSLLFEALQDQSLYVATRNELWWPIITLVFPVEQI